jgi:hypothetical protein
MEKNGCTKEGAVIAAPFYMGCGSNDLEGSNGNKKELPLVLWNKLFLTLRKIRRESSFLIRK